MLNHNNIVHILFFVIFTLLAFSATSQSNTHQRIKKAPQVIKIDLEKSDQVKVTVFNTNGHVYIQYKMLTIPFSTNVADYCYQGEKVQLTWISQWKTSGVIKIQITAYQYAYEITVNGVVLKKQENVVNNFVFDAFFYSKVIQPTSLSMAVKFNSQSLNQIYIGIIQTGFNGNVYQTVKTLLNKIQNNFTIDIDETINSYSFGFFYDQNLTVTLQNHLFDIFIQIPNQMLKGCDGTNLYDSKIRACPSKSTEPLDYLQIHKIGRYPSFSLLESQKTSIKIKIIEMEQFHSNQISNETILTLFIANISNKDAFKNMTQKQLKLNYPMRQECVMKSTLCHFIINLEPGNYTVMPVILDGMMFSYVYLFERGDGQNVIEKYYSTLPLIAQNNQFYYQTGALLQFAAHRQKLTQIQIQSETKIYKTNYMLFGNITLQDQSGHKQYTFNKLYDDDFGVPNHDPHKIKLFFQLQPNNLYLLFVRFASYDKFVQLSNVSEEQGQKTQLRFVQNLYLQTEVLQFSIKNGKFPHKKFNFTPTEDGSQKKQNESDESLFNGKILMTILGISTGIFMLIGLTILGKNLRNRIRANRLNVNQLVVQNPQSGVEIQLAKKKGKTMQISNVVHISIANDIIKPLL